MSKNKRNTKIKHKSKTRSPQAARAASTMVGTLDITRSGMGYVILKDPDLKDILVRYPDQGTAFHGDTVEVKITKVSGSSGRLEGKITQVIKRHQTEFIGTLSVSENYAFFIANSVAPMPDFYIPRGKYQNLPDGTKVIVRLTSWDKRSRKPEGIVVSTVSPEKENDFAMKTLLTNNGFTIGFSQEVEEETAQLPTIISEQEISKRKDFRDTLTFTIDPADAKDFDDAISFKKIDRSWYEIGVHIADVSHYVRPGTALDKEAALRATSVYLPDRVNPMLPEQISNVLCSLRPGEEKLTFSAVFIMNKKGQVKDTWIGKTVIHSDHRYTYEDVQTIIEGAKGPYEKEILWMKEMTQTLRGERFEKGAINFSSQEVKFKLDENGKPVGIEIKESKPAHQLVEEMMLLANKAVASYASSIKIGGAPLPFPYRVHDQPDEEKFASFVPFARKYGYTFDVSTPEKIAQSFNEMLRQAAGKPEQHLLEQLGVRTMAKAIYTTDNIGHYGLGFKDYCHFTSPIRRYPDVLVHRIIESCLQGHPINDKQLEEKCKHCSDRERAAMECERAGNKYKQVEYMQQFLGETFPGVVSGVADFGFWVETINEKCEGLVSIHSLMEPYAYIASDYMLKAEFSKKKIQMGDPVTIQVVAANLDKRQLDYHLVEEKENSGPGKSAQKPASSAKKKADKTHPKADKGIKKSSGYAGSRPENSSKKKREQELQSGQSAKENYGKERQPADKNRATPVSATVSEHKTPAKKKKESQNKPVSKTKKVGQKKEK
ncbi:ribonuclease R [Arachidicoccus rhizosphaerae]|nr:ribonuclease R [Arachidicoccus rhizosphaerae]